MTVLAASSPKYAAAAVEELLARDEGSRGSLEAPPQERVHFRVSPGGPCRDLRLQFDDFASIALPQAASSTRSVLFAIESGIDGRITDALPLYAEDPELAERLGWLLQQHAAILSAEADGRFQGFVALSASNGRLNYMFGGGSELGSE